MKNLKNALKIIDMRKGILNNYKVVSKTHLSKTTKFDEIMLIEEMETKIFSYQNEKLCFVSGTSKIHISDIDRMKHLFENKITD